MRVSHVARRAGPWTADKPTCYSRGICYKVTCRLVSGKNWLRPIETAERIERGMEASFDLSDML